MWEKGREKGFKLSREIEEIIHVSSRCRCGQIPMTISGIESDGCGQRRHTR